MGVITHVKSFKGRISEKTNLEASVGKYAVKTGFDGWVSGFGGFGDIAKTD